MGHPSGEGCVWGRSHFKAGSQPLSDFYVFIPFLAHYITCWDVVIVIWAWGCCPPASLAFFLVEVGVRGNKSISADDSKSANFEDFLRIRPEREIFWSIVKASLHQNTIKLLSFRQKFQKTLTQQKYFQINATKNGITLDGCNVSEMVFYWYNQNELTYHNKMLKTSGS